MHYLLYGENTYSSHQKVLAIKEKFLAATGTDFNLSTIDGGQVSFDEIARQISTLPFLGNKRLVIIKNLLIEGSSNVQEPLVDYLDKITSSSVVIFWEQGSPDKRTRVFKALNQPRQSQEFNPLAGLQINHWIEKYVEGQKGKIESQAVNKLASFLGSDLWAQKNEIDKLLSYAGSRSISADDVELLVEAKTPSSIFEFTDAVASGAAREAQICLMRLQRDGADEIYVLSMLVYQFRSLLIIKDLIEREEALNRFAISKKTHLHPYVVGKSLMVLNKFSLERLKQIYRLLFDFDLAIKTGRIEAGVAIDLIVGKLTVK